MVLPHSLHLMTILPVWHDSHDLLDGSPSRTTIASNNSFRQLLQFSDNVAIRSAHVCWDGCCDARISLHFSRAFSRQSPVDFDSLGKITYIHDFKLLPRALDMGY